MKVQCEVETDVWRAARVFSLENGDTMGAVVTNALKEFLQDRVGPVKRGVVEEQDTAGRTRGKKAHRAVEAEAPEAVKVSNPSPATNLREGYGWCKGCGVEQVKLPAFLCKECRVEAGEDL